jgi:hypothetical protein
MAWLTVEIEREQLDHIGASACDRDRSPNRAIEPLRLAGHRPPSVPDFPNPIPNESVGRKSKQNLVAYLTANRCELFCFGLVPRLDA